jgi:hypothetical protein
MNGTLMFNSETVFLLEYGQGREYFETFPLTINEMGWKFNKVCSLITKIVMNSAIRKIEIVEYFIREMSEENSKSTKRKFELTAWNFSRLPTLRI